ncbi:MAG: hypothetical protein LBL21_00425 [Rickettsiales bacterium]|nr:hypothetical protein [Rickettsiales bacterium]
MTVKIYCLLSEVMFRMKKEDLYLWLLLVARRRAGVSRFDDFRDRSKELTARPVEIDDSVIRELLGDGYYNSAKTDIHKVEKIVGVSILAIFDDHPVFAKFAHLKGLARNREFEVMYYGRVK